MQVDYLISGAGASGMAFLDTILNETDATVAITDRRDAPGGHWNDAYPFVRLHQNSSFYGVPSRQLGQERICQEGYNKGLFELATKYEILHYFQDLMENTYLPSGRVRFLPMSEHKGEGVIRSLVGGQDTRIEVRRKIVNAGIWGDQTTIPSTHQRSFEVADDVICIPPNDLPRQAVNHDWFTVLGAGKTAMDSILWLLSHGVLPDRIAWVRPNDYWIFCRDNFVAHEKFFHTTMASNLAELESLATAKSVEEHSRNMETCERWHRIDPNVWPTKFHAAVCSRAEMAALRAITNVIRAGHAKRIEPDRLVMQDGDVPAQTSTLYIDCTARGGELLDDDSLKVFDGDQINLFMLRPFQPVFSAALIAHLEACVPDEDLRQQCTRITNFHETPAQLLAVLRVGFLNQSIWSRTPEIRGWLDTCRLNSASHLMAGITPKDTDKLDLLQQFGPLTKRAMENIPRMLAAEDH